MKIPIYHVDAFAVEPFKGNPAAVCLLQAPRSAEWMQNVAAEMALSETAFLLAKGEGYNLRWFTPKLKWTCAGMLRWPVRTFCTNSASMNRMKKSPFTR